jgi:hypothetical protein
MPFAVFGKDWGQVLPSDILRFVVKMVKIRT